MPQANAEVERFNRVMKDGRYRYGGRSGVHYSSSSHVGGVSNDTTWYDGRDAGVTDAVISASYAPDDPATVVSNTTGVQLSYDCARLVSAMSDVEKPDRRHRVKPPTIQAGDMVRIRLPNRKH